MPCDSEFLYRWHTMPRAINRLTPPWEKVKIISHPASLVENEKVHVRLSGLIDWHLKIFNIIEGKTFSDTQLIGPFLDWTHIHSMQTVNESSSLLVERISFKLPILDSILSSWVCNYKLKPLFDYRFRTLFHDIKIHYKLKDKKHMKVLITGSSGLVGSALLDFLASGGHQVFKLVRQDPLSPNEINWNPESQKIDLAKLENFDVIIHLAGENIANKRWTKSQQKKIADSRILGTRFLVDSINKLQNPPHTFISASAIGFYGDRGEEILSENSSAGSDFLADTCIKWEQETKSFKNKSIRVVNARFGIILDPRAGALSKLLPIFWIGGGGILGNGKQWMSWIALDDVLGSLMHIINTPSISGPVNIVAPNPLKNSDFTKVLAKVMFRPALFPAPAFALRLALGKMADALLLSSTRVEPKILNETGFEFSYPDLESALKHMIN
ncbi:MAG: hypothetical protein RLZZ361_694 [Cyanobacteriota bacterium]